MQNLLLSVFTNLVANLDENWKKYLGVLGSLVAIFIGGRILIAILEKAIGLFADKKMKNISPERKKRISTAATLLKSVIRYCIYFVMVAAGLGAVGLSQAMTTLFASIGIGGLAIGFGAQSLIKDIVTGCFLLFEDQISVGDYVEIGGYTGIIESITLRTTSIRGFQGQLIVIPNGQVTTVLNYSRGDYSIYLQQKIANEKDIEATLEVMDQEIKAYAEDHKGLIKGHQLVGVVEVEPYCYTVRATIACNSMDQWKVERALKRRVQSRLEQKGIELPAQRVVLKDIPGGFDDPKD